MKRALLITYLYPPVGGMTPKVALNYARSLARAGYAVDVITPRPDETHPVYKLDPSRHTDTPNVSVRWTYPGPLHAAICWMNRRRNGNADAPGADATIGRARRMYRALIRPWIFPDGRVDWLPWAIGPTLRLVMKERYDVLVTCGFPFTCHLIGLLVHRAARRWIVHNGDVWSFCPDTGLPAWRRRIDKWLERKVLRAADVVILNTGRSIEAYRDEFPEIPEQKYHMIPMGYEASLYEGATPTSHDEFRIVYTGAVATCGSPIPFFESLAILSAEGLGNIRLIMAGNIPSTMHDYCRGLKLDRIVTFPGFLSTEEVVRLQRSASLLLLLGMRGGLQVPSKLGEYYAARRPILVVDYDGVDLAAHEVTRNRRGISCSADRGSIAAGIRRLYDLWQRATLEETFDLQSVPTLSWNVAGDTFIRLAENTAR